MANNVTVNITNNINCGCCGSGGTGTGSGSGGDLIDGVVEGEILDPETEGPPKGYIDPPIPISDRQCKMAVWLYTWIDAVFDQLANGTAGDVMLTAIATIPATLAKNFLFKVVSSLLVGVLTSMAAFFGTPGLPIDDISFGPLATIVTYAILSIISNQTVVQNFTKPTAAKILSEIQPAKDELICALAKAPNAYEAKAEYEKILATLDLSITQRSIAIVFLNNQLLHMLFYTAEWWPSFDEDILANISASCCGSMSDGEPITPGKMQCQAACYIIGNLIETFNDTNTYIEDFYYLNLNPFDNDTDYIRTQVEEGLTIPYKIKEKAASYPYYISMVAAYINATTVTGGMIDHYFGTYFADLASELETNRETITAALISAADEAAVYMGLYDPLDTFITANVEPDDPNLADYLRGSISGLLQLPKSKIPEMMFVQDPVIAFYDKGCSDNQLYYGELSFIEEIPGTLSDDGQTIVFEGAYHYDSYRAVVLFFGGCIPASISNIQVTVGNVADPPFLHCWRIFSSQVDIQSGGSGDLYNSNDFPSGSFDDVRLLAIISAYPFTVSVDYSEFIA